MESYDGFKWYVEKQDHRLPLSKSEFTGIEVLKELGSKDKVFVDVGAHVGKYAVRMAKYYGKVIAIEPNPEAVEVLKKNIELNNVSNVEILNVACGDIEEERILHIRGGSSTFFGKYGGKAEVKVKVARLDNLVKKADVVKIDVEGWELNVVRGAKKLIETCKPVFLIEHHEKAYEYKNNSVLEGTREKIREILGEYYMLFIGENHCLYVPKNHDLRNYRKAVAIHWINRTLRNIYDGKEWFHGLPYTWWWGMSHYEFICTLPERINSEDKWFELLEED